jgi:UPF0755 protein
MNSPKVLYVPQGSINKIITHLGERKLDVSTLDAFAMRFIGYPQHGWIEFESTHVSHADFLYALSNQKAAMVSITLIPGETSYFFLNDLAATFHLSPSRLQKALESYSPYLEGMFVPDTYKLPMGITEERAIKLLLHPSKVKMKQWSEKIFGTYDEAKWFQYVTLASIIQKEAASVEDMPMVSSVIYNRLKKGMKLQMDGTLNYGKYSHDKITSKRIKQDDSAYNTYKISGLPEQPVCNVGLDAIKAAIFPAKTEYLYFVKGKDGKHHYSSYYSTHIKNIHGATK